MDYYELIQAYLDNALTEVQRKEFEAEMERDPQLRLTVEQFPVILDAIHAAGQDDARELVTDVREQLRQRAQPKVRRLIPRQLSIAATFLILILAGIVIYANLSYSTSSLATTAYQKPPDLGRFQSAGEISNGWDTVMISWNKGDIDRALELARKFRASHPDDANVDRRLAYLDFQSGNYEEVLSLLGPLREHKQYGDYAKFHYAVTLLRLHREAEAEAQLDSIAGNDANRFQDEAKQMKSKLGSPLHWLAFQ